MERAALITGGSGGIGLAIAEMLGDQSHDLTLVARGPQRLADAVAHLAARGITAQGYQADVGQEAQVVAAVSAHAQRYGRLDVLVNAAGVGVGEPIAELTTERLDRQIETNLRSVMLCYRECNELLRAAGAEHRNALAVNIASSVGLSGAPFVSVYSAVKAGVIAWTQSMNAELAGTGVKSTVLCPGLVDTNMTNWIKDRVSPDLMIRPSDIAEAVRFLLRLSPECLVPELRLVGDGDAVRSAA